MQVLLATLTLAALAALAGPGPALPADALLAIPPALALAIPAGISAIGGLIQGNRAGNLQEEALDIQRQQFEAREPLRAIALGRLQSMLGGPAPDLNRAFVDETNPFASPLPRQAAPATPMQTQGLPPDLLRAVQGAQGLAQQFGGRGRMPSRAMPLGR